MQHLMRSSTRRKVLFASGFFWTMVVLIVALNFLNGGSDGAHFVGRSISWYVGRQTWSAVLFMLGNCLVASLIGRFLWVLGEKWQMQRLYFAIVILLVIAFIWLSIFPFGYFDIGGVKSPVSFLHQIGSRLLFFAMATLMFMLAWRARASKLLQCASYGFVAYAAFCAIVSILCNEFFYSAVFCFEAFYIFAFMMLLIGYSYYLEKK